jgi:hypothetical protein
MMKWKCLFGAPRQVGLGSAFCRICGNGKSGDLPLREGGLRDIESCSLAGAEEQLLLSRE